MLNNFWWITESVLEFKELIRENSIKCNWKKFKYSIQQICCRKSSYARIWYCVYSQLIFWFRLCQLQVMHYRKLFRLYSEKWKLRIVQYLNCSNYVSFSLWDRHQIGNKACCILSFTSNRDIYVIVICLVIMFTSRAMAFKMSEMANFTYFLLIKAKN